MDGYLIDRSVLEQSTGSPDCSYFLLYFIKQFAVLKNFVSLDEREEKNLLARAKKFFWWRDPMALSQLGDKQLKPTNVSNK